jgi:hypothetical protein
MHVEIPFATEEAGVTVPHGALNDAEAQPAGRWLGKRRSAGTGDSERVRAAAMEILDQGILLLQGLSPDEYRRRSPVAFNACIGGHYRHCLDHFLSLLRGGGDGWVDYDHRDRDPRIESDPVFALELTRRMRRQIEWMPAGALEARVRVRCEVSYAHGSSPVTGATLGRELAYCIAHAIHHFAIIAVIARMMEIPLPQHFGVAPSTVEHQRALRVG